MKFPDIGGGAGNSGGGGGLFLEMKDGSKHNGVLRGDPKVYRVHWVQQDRRYRPCVGGGTCELCKVGDDPKTRAKFNFIVKEDGVWLAKILDVSIRTFIDLKELHEGGYDLEETAIQITQKGEGTKKRITVLPIKNNGGLKPADLKAIGAVPLNPLKGDENSQDAGAETEGQDETEEDVPF